MSQTPNDPDPQFMSLQHGAQVLSISPHTLRLKIAAGDIAGYRVGGRIRLRRADVLALARPIPSATDR